MGLLRACHPGPTAAVSLLLTALAVAWGRGPTGSLLVLAAVLAGQLSIGWSNDLIDAERDIAVNREDKPVVTGEVTPRALLVASVAALLACVPLSLIQGGAAGAVHLVVVASGWAYNLGMKRTFVSWLPYAVAFGLFPAFVTLGLPGNPWPHWWVMAAGALLGVGAHIVNVLPDIADDLSVGVRGMPQRLGAYARAAGPVPLGAATVLLTFGPAGPLDAGRWAGLALVTALIVAVAVVPARAGRVRVPFLVAVAIAVVDVALLLLPSAAPA